VSNNLTIELPASENNIVTITNSLGLVVFNQSYGTGGTVTASLAHLPAGLYFVKVTSGNNTLSSKLIKTKQ